MLYLKRSLGFEYLVSIKRSVSRKTNLFFLLVAGSLAALLSFLSSISGLRRPQNEYDLTNRSRRPVDVLWIRNLKRLRRSQHCLSFVSTHDVQASVIVFVLDTCPWLCEFKFINRATTKMPSNEHFSLQYILCPHQSEIN